MTTPTQDRGDRHRKKPDDYNLMDAIVHLAFLLGATVLILQGLWASGLFGSSWTSPHPNPTAGLFLMGIGAVMACVWFITEAWTRSAKYKSEWWREANRD